MKIHEYQAKEILAKYGVAVPKGEMANTLEEAIEVTRKLFAEGASGVVVKAQIHAGGRGKGGGVKVARTREDAELHAKNILGMQLVTHQTGPAGQKVQRLLVEETAAIDRELYLGIVLDRATGKLVFMASQAGGMEIEEVAAKTPEAIFKETIDPAIGFGAWQARKLAFALGLKPTQINAAVTFLQSLYKAFMRHRRVAGRDQSIHHDQGRQAVCAGREDHLRRQRALPPSGHQGAARYGGRRSA